MNEAVRNRQNRTDNSQRLNEAFLGVMVSATAYNGEVRMVDYNVPVPASAEFAGRLADGLLPTEE
jgi:hypothetical protein